MPATYESIATTTLTSNASDVTFSNIPGTFTDLFLIMSLKVTTGATGWRFRLNDDTATNYSTTIITGTGSVAGSDRFSSQSFGRIAFYGLPETTNFTVSQTHFLNYSNSTTKKTIIGSSRNTANGLSGLINLWSKTPEAITKILIYPEANQFATNSTFTLYGIKAA